MDYIKDDKEFTFQLYHSQQLGMPEIKAGKISIMWPANDPKGAEDRISKWMERSSKIRARKCLEEWSSMKLIEETA